MHRHKDRFLGVFNGVQYGVQIPCPPSTVQFHWWRLESAKISYSIITLSNMLSAGSQQDTRLWGRLCAECAMAVGDYTVQQVHPPMVFCQCDCSAARQLMPSRTKTPRASPVQCKGSSSSRCPAPFSENTNVLSRRRRPSKEYTHLAEWAPVEICRAEVKVSVIHYQKLGMHCSGAEDLGKVQRTPFHSAWNRHYTWCNRCQSCTCWQCIPRLARLLPSSLSPRSFGGKFSTILMGTPLSRPASTNISKMSSPWMHKRLRWLMTPTRHAMQQLANLIWKRMRWLAAEHVFTTQTRLIRRNENLLLGCCDQRTPRIVSADGQLRIVKCHIVRNALHHC